MVIQLQRGGRAAHSFLIARATPMWSSTTMLLVLDRACCDMPLIFGAHECDACLLLGSASPCPCNIHAGLHQQSLPCSSKTTKSFDISWRRKYLSTFCSNQYIPYSELSKCMYCEAALRHIQMCCASWRLAIRVVSTYTICQHYREL